MFSDKMKGLIFLLIILILVTGCVKKDEEVGEQLRAKIGVQKGKILFVVAQKNFRDEELNKPKKILEDSGYIAEVASVTTDFAYGMLGAKIKPDLAVKDADADGYEYIVVVGGSGSPTLADYPEVLELLRNAKKTAAICLGPMVLAKAGVLNGKRATVYKTSESLKALEDGGAIFVDESIVEDGTLVTANGPNAADEFGRRILRILEKGE